MRPIVKSMIDNFLTSIIVWYRVRKLDQNIRLVENEKGRKNQQCSKAGIKTTCVVFNSILQ